MTVTEETARAALPCYECAGSTKITYCTWSDVVNGYVILPTTCVRCKGAGVITDQPTARTILGTPESWLHKRTCICNFKVDGPMGNPRCPSGGGYAKPFDPGPPMDHKIPPRCPVCGHRFCICPKPEEMSV